MKISFQEDLNFGVNDYKLEFKLKSNKIIETIQSEKNYQISNQIL